MFKARLGHVMLSLGLLQCFAVLHSAGFWLVSVGSLQPYRERKTCSNVCIANEILPIQYVNTSEVALQQSNSQLCCFTPSTNPQVFTQVFTCSLKASQWQRLTHTSDSWFFGEVWLKCQWDCWLLSVSWALDLSIMSLTKPHVPKQPAYNVPVHMSCSWVVRHSH